MQTLVKKVACFTILSLSAPLWGVSIGIRLVPEMPIPVGDAASPYYSLGGGATLGAAVELADLLALGPEFSFSIIPTLNTGHTIQVYQGGLSAGLYLYPTDRIRLRAGAAGGVYEAMNDAGIAYGNLWWKAGLAAAFRMSPTLALGFEASYDWLNYPGEPLYTGIALGASVQLTLNTKRSAGRVEVRLDQGEPVFPLLFSAYKTNPVGTLVLTNSESAEIRDVKVSFRAKGYTSSSMECGSVGFIKRGGTAEVPLYADFSDGVMNFTENGKLPGEVIVTYRLLGAALDAAKTVVIPVHNRNTMRWIDSSELASFISPNSPEVLDYSKYVSGVARGNLRSALNRNMQFAMYAFEALKVSGISWSGDDVTPYTVFHRDPSKLDFIQYPFQTLQYGSGDYDDIGLLYAALLEATGIETALIPLKDDFVVAFSLGITAETAVSLFDSLDRLLVVEESVWMPVSFRSVREGFVNAWYGGIAGVSSAVEGEEPFDFIRLKEAWEKYPPAAIRSPGLMVEKPSESLVRKSVDTDLMRYIASEFGPKIQELKNRIVTSGGDDSLYNQLGLVYVRAGMYEDAKTEFQKAAARRSVSALVNLGNLALLEQDFQTAQKWFVQALAMDPQNRIARAGVDRVKSELEQ